MSEPSLSLLLGGGCGYGGAGLELLFPFLPGFGDDFGDSGFERLAAGTARDLLADLVGQVPGGLDVAVLERVGECGELAGDAFGLGSQI